jgi:hypothetical protein
VNRSADAADRRRLAPGIVLLAIGLAALLSRVFGWAGVAPTLLAIGAAFFALSALSRFRGPLLPAGVLLGLGAGFLLRDAIGDRAPGWTPILFGLGAGFLLVAAIDASLGRRREPPPAIPGAVLIAVALAGAAAGSVALRELFLRIEPFWPAALIAAGILLIVSARRRRAA